MSILQKKARLFCFTTTSASARKIRRWFWRKLKANGGVCKLTEVGQSRKFWRQKATVKSERSYDQQRVSAFVRQRVIFTTLLTLLFKQIIQILPTVSNFD